MADFTLPDAFYRDVYEMAQARADMFRDDLSGVCSSPIEVLFGASFMVICLILGVRTEIVKDGNSPSTGFQVFVYPQHKIGPYRADFYLHCPSAKKQHVVVECDGHEFHERTKEQAAHDRSRDRWMVAQGYTVLRFTGSELHAAPIHRAFEALKLIDVGKVPA